MIDTISLTGLRVRGRHGVLASERDAGQDFIIDVVLEVELSTAASSDNVTDTVDYGVLAHRLADIVAGSPVNLIETLADRLMRACLDQPLVQAATVTVHKPQAPIALPFADVSVRLSRRRDEAMP